jgi:hypothetical protein
MVTLCPWSLAKSSAVVRPLTPALRIVSFYVMLGMCLDVSMMVDRTLGRLC